MFCSEPWPRVQPGRLRWIPKCFNGWATALQRLCNGSATVVAGCRLFQGAGLKTKVMRIRRENSQLRVLMSGPLNLLRCWQTLMSCVSLRESSPFSVSEASQSCFQNF